MPSLPLEDARTFLFVPGDRPDRFAKAAASGAGRVIVDLEDAVPPDFRAEARAAVVAALNTHADFVVRISAPGTTSSAEDVVALAESARKPAAVVVAKSQDPADLARISEALGCPIIALIESARGLTAASEIASSPAVVRLAFGAVDFSVDIDSTTDPDVLSYARSHLVAVSRSAGIAPPLDSPSVQIADLEAVAASARLARRYGMGGKLCIHPAQVPIVASAFLPGPEEIASARRVLQAARDEGAALHEGQMIDRAVLVRARRTLSSAGVGL